jgi:O-6-methylguanine DNA methyltransferase
MNLMISEAALRRVPSATPANIAVDIIRYAIGECALGQAPGQVSGQVFGRVSGQVLVARSLKGVCAILLGDNRAELEAKLAARFPQATFCSNEALVHDDLAQVIRFADDPSQGLHLTLDMRGTPLQRRIWEKLRAIPLGRTVTCAELARWIGPLVTPRMIAAACVANPIALAIPCHRVVRTDGDLAGYRQWSESHVRISSQRALCERAPDRTEAKLFSI